MRTLKLIKESIDLDGVGKVDITWDFDEEEYLEWLGDNGYENTQEALNEYIRDNISFDLEYFDNDTYHHMGYDTADYSELEYEFGEEMAIRVIKDLEENGQSSFETQELYNSQEFDVNNPEELNSVAMKILNHGEYYKGCRGFILTNGIIVYTPAEHNMVSQINGVKGTFDFIRKGNIRILNQSIDLSKEPTKEQRETLRRVIASYSDEELYVDILTDGGEVGVHYYNPDYRLVMGEIDRFFSEGIKPQGGGINESVEDNSFKSWFGNSVLVDKEGNPIKMYHGTDQTFNAFSKEHIGSTGSYEGYGFNFTPFKGRAESYNNKNVIEAYLRVENPMTTKSNKITLSQLVSIIREVDKGKPFTDTIVATYEPTRYNEKWNESYYRRALPVAARMIYEYNKENEYGDAGIYSDICLNGNGGVNEVICAFEKLGYDSVIHYDNDGRINTVVVFEPNQIKRVGNKTYTRNSDVMDEGVIKESVEGTNNIQFIGMSDDMKLIINGKQVARYNYEDSTAYPFIIYKNQLYVGDSGKTHMDLSLKAFGSFDGEDDFVCGRIWVKAKVNEFNHAIVSFWGVDENNTNCKPFVYEVAKKLKVNPNKIIIAVDDGNKITTTPLSEWNGYVHQSSESEKQQRNLHMMNAQEKHNNTGNFRKSRDEKLGKKLTSDSGKEMPMAQYHSLIYQESKNIIISEEQYNKLFKKKNKEIKINKDQYNRLFTEAK